MIAHHLLDNPIEALKNLERIRQIKPDFFDKPHDYVKSIIKDQCSRDVFFDAIHSVLLR
jgi:hypothetical protein